jgi:hypothetical protein
MAERVPVLERRGPFFVVGVFVVRFSPPVEPGFPVMLPYPREVGNATARASAGTVTGIPAA